ncbi:MAG: hypothetical protein ABWZ15_01050 [Acidimicrobiia bacterium]
MLARHRHVEWVAPACRCAAIAVDMRGAGPGVYEAVISDKRLRVTVE